MKPIQFLSTLALPLCFLYGCSDSGSGTNAPKIPATQSPKAGSTYTYNAIELDSLGRKIQGSDRTQVDSVIGADNILYGKSHVMTVTEPSTSLNRYFNFETNGDISEYAQFDFPLHSQWITYPIQSHGPNSITLVDTTILVGGISTHFVSKADLSYLGVSTLTIYDSSLVTVEIKAVSTTTITSSTQNETHTQIAYYYFAPSIGYIAKLRQDPFEGSNGSEETLIAFTLK